MTGLKISGAALVAVGMLLAQAPDPARSTMPGATPSSMQDRNNAAPGSMRRNTMASASDAKNNSQTVTGYLVAASCSNWKNAGMPARTPGPAGDMVNRSSPRDATSSAMSPSGDVTSGQMSPRDPTMDPVTQGSRTTTQARRGTMRTDTRPSATEMANSENMIEDRVNAAGERTMSDMAASTQLTWSKPPSACSATLSTTEFAIFSNGKVYYFDAATNSNFQHQYQSNEKMKMALSNGMTSPVFVTASGSVKGDTIHVMRLHRGQ